MFSQRFTVASRRCLKDTSSFPVFLYCQVQQPRYYSNTHIDSKNLFNWCATSGIHANKLRLSENPDGVRGLYLNEDISAVRGEPLAAVPFEMILSKHTIQQTEFGQEIDFLWPDVWEEEHLEEELREGKRDHIQLYSLLVSLFL